MEMHKVRVVAGMHRHDTKIFIDDIEITRCVTEFKFSMAADPCKLNELQLTLIPTEFEFEGDASVLAERLVEETETTLLPPPFNEDATEWANKFLTRD